MNAYPKINLLILGFWRQYWKNKYPSKHIWSICAKMLQFFTFQRDWRKIQIDDWISVVGVAGYRGCSVGYGGSVHSSVAGVQYWPVVEQKHWYGNQTVTGKSLSDICMSSLPSTPFSYILLQIVKILSNFKTQNDFNTVDPHFSMVICYSDTIVLLKYCNVDPAGLQADLWLVAKSLQLSQLEPCMWE